jgi:hypothetical protein
VRKCEEIVNLEVSMAIKPLATLIVDGSKPIDNGSSLRDRNEHSSLNDSSSLTRSMIVDFYPSQKFNSVNSNEARQLGSTVSDRAEQIFHQAKGVRNLIVHASENPTRFGCSVIALVTGLTQIYSGNLVTGGIATLCGAKELYNQSNTGDTSTLHRLLNDINADVDMIKTLEEGQQQSFKVVEENLTLIRKDVDGLYGKLEMIKDLNTQGIHAIEEGKRQAYEKGIEAKLAYREALNLFSEVKESFSSSKATYAKCAGYFTRIQDIAKEESDTPILEKVNALVEVAEKANLDCEMGKSQLDTADEKLSQAMQALSKASTLNNEAAEMISRTMQNAEDTLKAGIEKVQYTEECAQRIQTTQRELEEITERSEDVMQLLSEMSDDVKKAKTEALKKLDPTDVVVGVGTGVLLSSLGTFSALAIGVTASYAWHNGTTIADTTKKVYNYFFGMPLPPSEPMKAGELIQVSMDQKSSGYYGGWVKGRPSNTYGSLNISLGDEIAQFRFDLNQKQYPVSKEDLFALYSKMFAKLENKTLSPEDCERILSQLASVTMDRGDLYASGKGLINRGQAAHGLVKALNKYCEKLKNISRES